MHPDNKKYIICIEKLAVKLQAKRSYSEYVNS